MLSIIIPAHNEATCIGACLDALLDQRGIRAGAVELIVVANACTDATATIAGSYKPNFAERGWRMTVLDLSQAGKTNALNQGDGAASGEKRLYLDADVICAPGLIAQLLRVLDRREAVYASGQFRTSPAQSWATRHYIRLWTRLPFMTSGVTGGGLFAVNAAARKRWSRFPDIIADDSFARLHFSPGERIGVPGWYVTPMAEGWQALVRVRRRWEAGSRQIAQLFPHLLVNEGKPPLGIQGHLRLIWQLPISYCVYVSIRIAARFGGVAGHGAGWARGR